MVERVTSAQIRAARGLLNWSVRTLQEKSGVHRNTITNFETGKSGGDDQTIARLRKTLENHGVIFIAENGEGAGVRLQKLSNERARRALAAMSDEEDRKITAAALADPDARLVDDLFRRRHGRTK